MDEGRCITGAEMDKAYLYSREDELKRMGKGVLWYMVNRDAGLVSTSHKDLMVAAIMRQEAKRRAEKDRGEEGGGCGMLHAATRLSAKSAAVSSMPNRSPGAATALRGKGVAPPRASLPTSGEGLEGGGMLHT